MLPASYLAIVINITFISYLQYRLWKTLYTHGFKTLNMSLAYQLAIRMQYQS